MVCRAESGFTVCSCWRSSEQVVAEANRMVPALRSLAAVRPGSWLPDVLKRKA